MGKVIDVKCPSCNAVLKYDAKKKLFKCEYCGSEYKASDLKKEELKEEINVEYVTYNCPDCGAEIIADSETSATFCVYCGNTAILKNKLSGKFKPDFIIPFKKDKKEAEEAFKNLGKGRPLVPKKFSDIENIEKIRGLYVPFWLFDTLVDGRVVARSTKSTSWSVGNTVYTKTDIYEYNSEGNMTYEKVPVDGSTRFSDDIMNTIEPFKYSELEEFNPAYLSGFLAEKYDLEALKCFKDIEGRSIKSTQSKMISDMKGPGIKTIRNSNLVAKEINHKYALLPVWMVNVKYKNKYYLFAMNGQTGEFVGNIPVDKKKAVLYFILTFIGTLLIIAIISYLVFLLGGHR